jgi:hypothetical protein
MKMAVGIKGNPTLPSTICAKQFGAPQNKPVLIDTFRRNNMYKLLIAAVLILASLAPASARQKAHNATGKSNVVKAYKWNTYTCSGPYIGDWKYGYPGSRNDC